MTRGIKMKALPTLNIGDRVEVIAPASRCSNKQLMSVLSLLRQWQLQPVVNEAIFGQDLLCANNDEARFEHLKKALLDPTIKAVICARGGYGSMRLIPALSMIKPPRKPKIFIGMSDITALNLFLQQHWHWPVIHGAINPDIYSEDSITAIKDLLLAKSNITPFNAKPLNERAKSEHYLEAIITGGNLSLIQASIGTLWQVDPQNKILFIEEVGERAYRIDRMLAHLIQTDLLKQATAIVFGDMSQGQEPDGSSLIEPVLKRFAQELPLPVVKISGIGHEPINYPLPLGTKAKLQLGSVASFSF